MRCRIIGGIKALQQERDGDEMRNDRYIAIPEASGMYGHIRKLSQLPKQIVQEIERFFINYNEQAGKQFRPLSWMPGAEALKTVREAQGKPGAHEAGTVAVTALRQKWQGIPTKNIQSDQEKTDREIRRYYDVCAGAGFRALERRCG